MFHWSECLCEGCCGNKKRDLGDDKERRNPDFSEKNFEKGLDEKKRLLPLPPRKMGKRPVG